MSELEDIRTQLRGNRDRESDSGADGPGWRVLFFGLGAARTALLFILVAIPLAALFVAWLWEVHPSLALRLALNSSAGSPPSLGRNIVANYQGKSAAAIGEIADQVCAQRTHERYPYDNTEPRMSDEAFSSVAAMNHYNALMHCLLTEGTLRYCSAPERRMIVGEIDRYFSLIARHNRAYELWIVNGRRNSSRPSLAFAVNPDPPVVGAIVSRLREGLLTKVDRDQIIAAASELRDRLVSIEPPKSNCPDEPWWAFWR